MENIGVSGIVDPGTAIAIISLLQAIFAWFRDNDQKYLLCGKCGNYEVLRENS